MIEFKTIESVYEVDDEANTWSREPNDPDGPSAGSGRFKSRTPIVVGLRVLFDDPATGVFRTSVVKEILDAGTAE